MNFPTGGVLILLLGLMWAAESVLGKIVLSRDVSAFNFPLILNIGTVISVSVLCLHPKYRSNVVNWNREAFAWMLCVALSMVFIPYCILYLSLREITPAEASLITSLTPVFSMIIGTVIYRTSLGALPLFALCLGALGAALMIVPRLDQEAGRSGAIWYALMLIVPFSYAASGYFLKKCATLNVSYIQLLLVTNLVSAGLFLLLNKGLPVSYGNGNGAIYISGIALNISAIALMLYISGRMSPFALSFSNYATLMFAFILSVLIFSQQFSASLIVAMTLIVASSLIVQARR